MRRSNPSRRDHEVVITHKSPASLDAAYHHQLRVTRLWRRGSKGYAHVVFIIWYDLDPLPVYGGYTFGSGRPACRRGTHKSIPFSKQKRAKKLESSVLLFGISSLQMGGNVIGFVGMPLFLRIPYDECCRSLYVVALPKRVGRYR